MAVDAHVGAVGLARALHVEGLAGVLGGYGVEGVALAVLARGLHDEALGGGAVVLPSLHVGEVLGAVAGHVEHGAALGGDDVGALLDGGVAKTCAAGALIGESFRCYRVLR